MSNELGTFGVDFDSVDGQRGMKEPEAGRRVFRITKVSANIQKKGDNEGAKCINAMCAELDDSGEPTGAAYNKFLGLGLTPWKNGGTQLGVTKGWLEDIGRDDLLSPNASIEELIGTEFEALISKREWEGRIFTQDADIKPLSHAEVRKPTPPAKPAPAGRRAR